MSSSGSGACFGSDPLDLAVERPPSGDEAGGPVVPIDAAAGPPCSATGSAAPAAAGPAPIDVGAGRAGTVTRVVDGDTVEVIADGGGEVTMRVLGINTPATKDPRRPVQCWGPQASQFATDTLLRQPVRLVGDPTQDSRDRYGRLLAYVYLPDGPNFSMLAAAAGAARAYVYDVADREQPAIPAAAEQARAAGRGLWGACGG